MSGMGGIVKFNGERVEQTELDRMLNILRPYGPDREQTLKLNNSGFVHTLMRVTPEDYFERQPARVGSNQILCSDARIDNREELCSRFNLHPAKAKTLPDSFFILKAYEKWGEACPNYLLGDFTFVIWDAKAQSLFAARDHFGVRPLFYVHKAGTFA
ncbi:MAG: hypothetical protein MI864_04880, partial [Pseudomonadales bacterium]|nr:hypothetical protein [Pseudomonadales bacterium]